jgi:hypothetical protein
MIRAINTCAWRPIAALCILAMTLVGCAAPMADVSLPETTVMKGIRVSVDRSYRKGTIGMPLIGISGLATNETGRPLRMLMIEFGAYDAAGIKLSSGMAALQSLAAGASWRFDALFVSLVDRSSQLKTVQLENVTSMFAD